MPRLAASGRSSPDQAARCGLPKTPLIRSGVSRPPVRLPSSDPDGQSDAFGTTTGPDGALWFFEPTANQIGRVTAAGLVKFGLERDDFSSSRHRALAYCWSMIFFRKPVSTFRDHALTGRPQGSPVQLDPFDKIESTRRRFTADSGGVKPLGLSQRSWPGLVPATPIILALRLNLHFLGQNALASPHRRRDKPGDDAGY